MPKISILLSIFLISRAFAASQDYHLKSTAGITVLNHYGSIDVQGWSLDKVRVEVKKSPSPSDAYEVDQSDNRFEIRTILGKNQFLAEKLKTRNQSQKDTIDLVIRAPSRVPLTILARDSKINLRNWNAPTEISASTGVIRIANSAAPSMRMACPACEIKAESYKGILKISGGSGSIDLKELDAQDLFVESTTGTVSLDQVKGSGILMTDSGELRAKRLDGSFAFKSRSASVLLTETKGSIHGETKTGNIHIEVKEWNSADKQLISSEEGNIHVALPPSYSGEVEAVSQLGKLNLDYPLEKTEAKKIYGPEPMNHFSGKRGHGGELLSIQSVRGNIWLLQAI